MTQDTQGDLSVSWNPTRTPGDCLDNSLKESLPGKKSRTTLATEKSKDVFSSLVWVSDQIPVGPRDETGMCRTRWDDRYTV